MEENWYTAKQLIDNWRSQRGNKRIPSDKWQWKHNDPKPMGCNKGSSKREVYGNTRKISNKQPKLTSKATRERRINKTQS